MNASIVLSVVFGIGICVASIRNGDMDEATCSSVCGTNAQCTTGKPCSETCGTDFGDDIRCQMYTSYYGCYCNEGFVFKDGYSYDCVQPNQCANGPTMCKTSNNETWSECTKKCSEETCDVEKQPQACTTECEARCTCLKGFVRNSAGNCILRNDCTP